MSVEPIDISQWLNLPPMLLLIYLINTRLTEVREELKRQTQVIIDKIAPQRHSTAAAV